MPISEAAVPRAVEKAEHYRLLNEPEQAESICLDALSADPGNQRALVVLILAITDRFGRGGGSLSGVPVATYLGRLTDEYQRSYYRGIVGERQARAYLRRGPSKVDAYEAFRDAMGWYEKAAAIRPEGDDEALLRWNACARTIRHANLRPRPPEPELPLE